MLRKMFFNPIQDTPYYFNDCPVVWGNRVKKATGGYPPVAGDIDL